MLSANTVLRDGGGVPFRRALFRLQETSQEEGRRHHRQRTTVHATDRSLRGTEFSREGGFCLKDNMKRCMDYNNVKLLCHFARKITHTKHGYKLDSPFDKRIELNSRLLRSSSVPWVLGVGGG